MLIPALEDPEPRSVVVSSFPLSSYQTQRLFIVHGHAAPALINICEGVKQDTILPYLDPIVERLLKLTPRVIRRLSGATCKPCWLWLRMRARLLLQRWASAPGRARGCWMMRLILFVSTIRRLCRCCWMLYGMRMGRVIESWGSRPWNVQGWLVRLASFSFFLTLTDPVFLKQSPLAQAYPSLMRKRYSCTSNVCHFSSFNHSTAGKLTKFPVTSFIQNSL